MIRIVIADDHLLVLEGLAKLLADEPGFEVVGRCLNGEQALEAVQQKHPDVLIVDLSMPVLNGLGVLAALQHEKMRPRTILLSGQLTDDEVFNAIRLGVQGIVLKEMAPRLLIDCVRQVSAGGQWLARRSLAMAVNRMQRREQEGPSPAERLTPRERELVGMVARGLRNKEIAARCNISEGTVRIHLSNIYQKLKVNSRVELSRLAYEHGL